MMDSKLIKLDFKLVLTILTNKYVAKNGWKI